MPIIKNAVEAMESELMPESVTKARAEAEKNIFMIRLAELRKMINYLRIPFILQTGRPYGT